MEKFDWVNEKYSARIIPLGGNNFLSYIYKGNDYIACLCIKGYQVKQANWKELLNSTYGKKVI